MADAPIDIARDLYDTIDRLAAGASPDEPLPLAIVDAIGDAGIAAPMVPREVGGLGLPLADCVDVYREIARADGSAGWCMFAADAAATFFGAYLTDEGVADIFTDGVPLMAGQFAPNGTAVRDGDDLVVTGDYQFGSGIAHAEWAGAGVMTVPAEEGEEGEDAQLRFLCLPVSDVELKGNWDVLGLQATASYDYTIREARVPERHSFDFFDGTVYRGGPAYTLGVLPLTAAGHAGWALGVTRRVLDEVLAIAASTARMGASSSLADSERFLFEYGALEGRYRAGEAWVRRMLEDAEAEAHRDGGVSEVTAGLVREACRHVNQGGADIARQAYLLAGTKALRDGPIQRGFRDLHAGSQHFFASPLHAIELSRILLAEQG